MQGVAANYEVVGASIVANGEGWNNNAAANLMTTDDGGATYTLTIEGVTLDAGTNYEYKIVEKGSWTEYFPNTGSNATFTVSENGVYTIKYVYTVSTSSCIVQYTKTGEAGAITHTYTVAGEPAALFGEEWNPAATANDMTANGDVYTWTKENVVLDGSAIEFKVCQDHAWTVAYPSKNYSVTTTSNPNHGYTGAGTYDVTITFNSTSKEITPAFTLQAAQDAQITSVAIRGAYASDTEWANAKTLPLTGSENVYTSPIAIDMSTTLEDFVFGLVVNGTFVNFEKVTIDEASSSLLVDDGSANHNILFKNSTSGYQTYTATATWTPGPDATAGWTLKVTGVDPRVLEYYLVGDLTGGFPGSDTDQTKDVKMTKQTNGLYTYEVASFAAEAQKYEYKLRANKIWGLYELPSSGNADYTFAEPGNYKLTFTANVTDVEIEGVSAYTLKLDAKKLEASLPGTTIWESASPVAAEWNGSDATKVSKDKFADAKVGDILHIAIKSIEDVSNDWDAQVILRDGEGTQLEAALNVGKTSTTDAQFVITGDMLNFFKLSGMIIAGQRCTIDQATIETTSVTGTDESIWVGNTTGKPTIDVNHFLNANAKDGVKAGDIIRVHATTTATEDIYLILSYSGSDTNWSWVNYEGMTNTTIDGGFEFEVNEANVAQIKKYGVIINQSGYTVTQVELIPAAVDEIVLWKSSTSTDVNWGYAVEVPASKMSQIAIGDVVRVFVDEINGTDKDWSTQVALKDQAKETISDISNIGKETAPLTIDIPVTGDIYAIIKEAGFRLGNGNYTTKKVTLLKEVYPSATEQSVWLGDWTMSWYPAVTINKVHFGHNLTIKAGDVLRVTTNATGEANLTLCSNVDGWPQLTGSKSVDGAVVSYVLTADDVTALTTNGLILHGQDSKALMVELIPLTGYNLITSDGSWTVGDKLTEDEGVYTATVSGAGKYFAIAPNTALNATGDAIANWGAVVRPVTTDGDFIVNFANYSDNTEYNANGKVWVIGKTNDADVTIQFTPADGKFAISCQTEVEITDGYATYSNAQMYTVEGATANFVTVNSELTEATLVPQTEGAILPASGVNTVATGKGIVLSGSGPAIIKSVGLTATAVDATGNMLTGTGDYTFNLNADKYTAYLLQTVNGQTGFQKWNGDTTTPLAAHKAFLAIPNVTASAPAFISFGGGTTGIEAVTQSQRTGQYYTLDGRRVENPTKGLYIINGKKVILK